MTTVIITDPKHPFAGCRGVVVPNQKPGPFGMVKVRLHESGIAEAGHECFVIQSDLKPDPHSCERCGGSKIHSRTKGLRCPRCD